jgi:hypothetical protein
MPAERPGKAKYVTNSSGGNIQHGAAVLQSGFAGQAIKVKAPDPTAALVNPAQIANGEDFIVRDKGEHLFAAYSGAAQGDAVYITSGNVLTKTATSNSKFGRTTAIAGVRGTPTGQVRIDLEARADF